MDILTASSSLQIFGMALLPGIETRLAIPFGVLYSDLSLWRVIAVAFLGSLVVLLVVTPLLYRFGETLKTYRFTARLFTSTRRRHQKRFKRSKDLALATLVALPLPFSGVWTGMVAAFLFGIPLRRTIVLAAVGSLIGSISLGLIVSGVLVSLQ